MTPGYIISSRFVLARLIFLQVTNALAYYAVVSTARQREKKGFMKLLPRRRNVFTRLIQLKEKLNEERKFSVSILCKFIKKCCKDLFVSNLSEF